MAVVPSSTRRRAPRAAAAAIPSGARLRPQRPHGGEPLRERHAPGGPPQEAGEVQVGVGVEEAGVDERPGEIDRLRAGRIGIEGGEDRRHPAPRNVDAAAREEPPAGEEPRAAHDALEGRERGARRVVLRHRSYSPAGSRSRSDRIPGAHSTPAPPPMVRKGAAGAPLSAEAAVAAPPAAGASGGTARGGSGDGYTSTFPWRPFPRRRAPWTAGPPAPSSTPSPTPSATPSWSGPARATSCPTRSRSGPRTWSWASWWRSPSSWARRASSSPRASCVSWGPGSA